MLYIFIMFKLNHAQLSLFELKSKNYTAHLNAVLSIRRKIRDDLMFSPSCYVVNLMPNKIICFSNFYK